MGWCLPHHPLRTRSLKIYFGVDIKSEAMGEYKNGESWNDHRKQANSREPQLKVSVPRGRMKQLAFFWSFVKMFTSNGLYSWVLEIPVLVQRTRVLADFLGIASAHPCPSTPFSCESYLGKRPGSQLIFLTTLVSKSPPICYGCCLSFPPFPGKLREDGNSFRFKTDWSGKPSISLKASGLSPPTVQRGRLHSWA